MENSVTYYNRYTGKIEEEAIYGESWLRWAYGNSVGKVATKYFAANPLFSKWYGWLMSRPHSSAKVGPFIEKYAINMKEAEYTRPESYSSFNTFFMRRLKPEARPVANNHNEVVFPADGRHLGFQNIADVSGIFVKGQQWSLEALLGDAELAKKYARGSLVLSRLCPVDYHHFHFPVDGRAGPVRRIGGSLYSVNPIALRESIRYLLRNRRFLGELELENGTTVLMMEIGATNVGSVHYAYKAGDFVTRGERKGWFSFGGSAVIVIFPEGMIELSEDLRRHTQEHREIYAHMGDVLGTWKHT